MSAVRKPRSQGAKAALLRSGAGKHADRRTRRLRTREASKREAIKAHSW